MNKLSIITTSFLIAMSMADIAHADNKWTGLYAGVNAGFAFNDAQLYSQHLGFTLPSATCNTSSNYSTPFSGAQVGYAYQFPNYMVTGVEANVTFNANQTEKLGCHSPFTTTVYDHFEFRDQMQASIKGRIGRALNWNKNILLPYLTAGASFANLGLTYHNEVGDYYSTNTTEPGFLIGAGVEWAFMQHWSLRAEYYYIDYNTLKLSIPNVYGLIDPNGGAKVNLSSNNVAVAVNYWL